MNEVRQFLLGGLRAVVQHGGLLCLLLLSTVSAVSAAEMRMPLSRIRAMRVENPPRIDGRLDDAQWSRAEWFEDFVQKLPTNGELPSRATSFAVLFDDEALYFGVRCAAESPEEIVTRLVRRDREAEFDTVEITLSPRADNRTAYSFVVNPDGVKRDLYWSTDTTSDAGWDAVWRAETERTEREWTVEAVIPLNQLRFSGGVPFGLQVSRWMSALKERVLFNPVPDSKGGSISTAGELTGVEGLRPKRPLTFTPESYVSYAASNNGFDATGGEGLSFGGGGYAQVGISSDLVADFAVLPDFGQVEVDEVVLNLSTYETLFPEKRPFFLEGAGLFSTPIQLFYSRRVGRPPASPALSDTEEVTRGVAATPILGAAKLTGRTESGLSLGFIDAVYLPTEFLITDTETESRFYLEGSPWTNALVLRSVKEVGRSGSVGFLGTALNPEGRAGAYAGGVDWGAYSSDRRYAWTGQVAGSARLDEIDGRSETDGGSIWTQVGRVGGEPIRYSATYRYVSKGFDPNDLGYSQRDDLHYYAVSTNHNYLKQWGPFRQIYTAGGIDGNWNTDGVRLYHSAWFLQGFHWKSHWYTQYLLYGGVPYFDDREMRGGPPLRFAGFGGVALYCHSPEEKPFGFSLTLEGVTKTFGYMLSAQTTLSLRLGRIEVELTPKVKRTDGNVGYVDTLNADTEDEVFTAAHQALTELNLSLKGTAVFTRDLTLQLQGQLLNVHADYSSYSEVMSNGELRPIAFLNDDGTPREADFARTDLVLQALLRWEFRPGSTLFLIYTFSGLGNVDENVLGIGDGLRDLGAGARRQVLMFKLSRRFG